MPFTVTTFNSPDDLAAAIQATVTVHSSEQSYLMLLHWLQI